MRTLDLLSIVGARPQFIKAAAIVAGVSAYNALASENLIRHEILHSGQHYDYEMSRVFFQEFDLPEPVENLGIGSGTHGQQTAVALERTESYLLGRRPSAVIVYGDTNTTLAAALASVKQHIPVAHVEAGLREYKKSVPEEVNRVLTDHVSSFLFCPTDTAVLNLRREGFSCTVQTRPSHGCRSGPAEYPTADTAILLNTGDVMVDVMKQYLSAAERRSCPFRRADGSSTWEGEYFLATLHRAENTDDPKRLAGILQALGDLARQGHQIVLPLHPRTRARLAGLKSGDSLLKSLTVLPPMPYIDMLALQKNARLVLTDSGGVQKEAFLLGVPVVTLRDVTGWPETVAAGWNTLAGAERDVIVERARGLVSAPLTPVRESLFGDGHAADRIVRALAESL